VNLGYLKKMSKHTWNTSKTLALAMLFSLCQKNLSWGSFFQDWWNSLCPKFTQSDILGQSRENTCIQMENFYEMCSVPCSRFVWLSKPQLQQARTEFPKSRMQKLKSLVPKECHFSGTVLVFAGEVAKIRLEFAL